MVEGLLRHHLADRGAFVRITSAGVRASEPAVDVDAVRAVATFGPDIAPHAPRQLSREIIECDGTDLVITMTRDHLRQVVALDRRAWPRTFTLRELVRRASADGDRAGADLQRWAEALGTTRAVRQMLTNDPADDVDDPHGLAYGRYEDTARELDHLVRTLVALAPWPQA
jgi:protein-tyrosine phosphatase